MTQAEIKKPFTALQLMRAVAATALSLLTAMPSTAQISQAVGAQGAPKSLHIIILDGEGALNNIRERTAREPIVQVEDENHKPVSEAAVVFLIHGGNNGASASFGNSTSFTTKTGPDGKAQAQGLQVGTTPGTFTITVTATLGDLVAETVIHQSNVITALNAGSNANGTSNGSRVGNTAHGVANGVGRVTTIILGTAVAAGVTIGVIAGTTGSTSQSVKGQVGSTPAKPIH